jgi:XisI protein
MDNLNEQYLQIIERVFQEHIDFLGASPDITTEIVIDRERCKYLVIETGWQRGYRIYGVFFHIDIIDDKLWIQHDGSESGIAEDLVAAGIPKSQIVLAYKPLENRRITEFAIS